MGLAHGKSRIINTDLTDEQIGALYSELVLPSGTAEIGVDHVIAFRAKQRFSLALMAEIEGVNHQSIIYRLSKKSKMPKGSIMFWTCFARNYHGTHGIAARKDAFSVVEQAIERLKSKTKPKV